MKSRFVSTLSIFAIIVGAFGTLSALMQLASYWTSASQPEMESLMLASFEESFGLGLTAEQVRAMLLRGGTSGLVVSGLSIVIGVALKRRAGWARPASIYFIFFITLGMISSQLSTGYRPELPLYWAGLVLTVLALFIHAGIILRLRSPEVRAEFGH
jgi:hypothetical protein